MHSYALPAGYFASGISAHLTIWIHEEWDAVFHKVLLTLIFLHHVLAIAIPVILTASNADTKLTALVVYGILLRGEFLHVLGTFVSIYVYRVFFHPLGNFPGPFWARVSMWWRVYRVWDTGHRHPVELDELHMLYGDVVRIGTFI